ncbi:papilin-like [Paramacrobiotus metropolitanus]|uniref:papilin-like n=1 Tax=Paramacrobiotus metropolitanus TaxID=2943436 RepID=UPI00244617B9|nr:papilin-like [Paramacrobiotus metropolitanus]
MDEHLLQTDSEIISKHCLTGLHVALGYGPCSSSCGGGRQSRPVVCVRTSDYEPVDDELCDALVKPQPSRQCNVDDPCPAFRTRRAVCTSENGTVYPLSMCASAKKPELSDACANAPPCDAMWFSTECSKCSQNAAVDRSGGTLSA